MALDFSIIYDKRRCVSCENEFNSLHDEPPNCPKCDGNSDTVYSFRITRITSKTEAEIDFNYELVDPEILD